MNNREKHQRSYGSLDQLKEDIAENLELGSQFWSQEAKGNTQHHGSDHLEREVFVERLFVDSGHVCDLVVFIGEQSAEGLDHGRAP
ncbi:hypothetical protein D3C76_1199300 [compost metagenome]